MSIINYNQVPINISGWGVNTNGIVAQNLSIDFSNNLEPIFAIGNSGAIGDAPNGPIRASCNLQYLITGTDPFLTMFYYPINNSPGDGAKITLNNLELTGVYLNSLSIQGQINSVVQGNAGFTVYMSSFTGALTASTPLSKSNLSIGHGAGTTIGISNALSFNWQGTHQFSEDYQLGAITPNFPLNRLNSSSSMEIEASDLSQAVTLCGEALSAIATVKDVCGVTTLATYGVTGKISNRNLNIVVGETVKGSLTIINNTI